MSGLTLGRGKIAAGVALLLVLGGLGGFGLSRLVPQPAMKTGDTPQTRKVLYWYDPMVPGQKFDKPGKSPFMDMQLVPRYADEAPSQSGIAIDPARTQSLGVRVVAVEQGLLESALQIPGVIDFNGRDIAIVQARTAGFVQSVPRLAPGDIVSAGAPLATVLVPEWSGAQTEFLAVRRTGDAALIAAARQRLALLGMSPGQIAAVERTGQPQATVTVTAPIGGVIKTLSVRSGMTLGQGMTLAEINGLSTVWFNAAIPEPQAAQARVGLPVSVSLTAFPAEPFPGRVTAILPEASAETRTLTARIELANRGGRLRPGMFGEAQLAGAPTPALLVPTEAVIRTGRRAIVMLALPQNRYQAAEVQTGREAGGKTEILSGLAAGERIVASGQFLIESEASLAGMQARPADRASAPPEKSPVAQYDSQGRVERLQGRSITLSHAPVPALQWPAMTMAFTLADPNLAKGLKAGDRVAFSFDQTGGVPTVRRISKVAAP